MTQGVFSLSQHKWGWPETDTRCRAQPGQHWQLTHSSHSASGEAQSQEPGASTPRSRSRESCSSGALHLVLSAPPPQQSGNIKLAEEKLYCPSLLHLYSLCHTYLINYACLLSSLRIIFNRINHHITLLVYVHVHKRNFNTFINTTFNLETLIRFTSRERPPHDLHFIPAWGVCSNVSNVTLLCRSQALSLSPLQASCDGARATAGGESGAAGGYLLPPSVTLWHTLPDQAL